MDEGPSWLQVIRSKSCTMTEKDLGTHIHKKYEIFYMYICVCIFCYCLQLLVCWRKCKKEED